MKRITLIISLVALFALNCNAQKGKVKYGLKFGPDLNWASSASSEGKNNGVGIGLRVGAFFDRYYNDRIAVSWGLDYKIGRMKYQFTDYRRMQNFLEPTVVTANRTFSGSWVEVPLKLKMRIDIDDDWKVIAEGGAGLGVSLKAKGKDTYEYLGNSYSDTEFTDCSDQYRLIQAALHFGLGTEYELNSTLNVFAQFTYSHGLLNMFTRELQEQTGSDLKSHAIGLEVGILF